jgi:signal peptidase II
MILITLGVIIADQLSKFYIKGTVIPFTDITINGMYLGESIPVLENFFRITFTENPGMAFGFDPGSDFKLWISLFSLAASIGLLIYLYVIRNKSLSLRLAIALILGGAIGNLIDRMFYGLIFDYAPLFYGKVVDFFDFDFFNFTILGRSYERWPIFNIADASVTIGVLILLFFYRQSKDVQESPETQEEKSLSSEDAENSPGLIIEKTDLTDDKNKIDNEQISKGKEI